MLTAADRRVLEQGRLFRGIDLATVELLLDGCTVIHLRGGGTLMETGQANSALYLVLDGELNIQLGTQHGQGHAVLGPGECVGELSLIDGNRAAASVLAGRDTRLLEIPHAQVWTLVDTSQHIARNLLTILAGRMRNDNAALVTTQERSLGFERAASVDPLTGLHNRRWMDEAFPRTMLRCQRDQVPVCLFLLDLDHFKRLNDTHGHLAGDDALREVARLITLSLRPQDLLARFGGEEFAALLPDTPSTDAESIAERLRAAIEAATLHATQDHEHLRVTTSIGAAAMRMGDSLDSLLDAADTALYQAKAAGRNRVKMADACGAARDGGPVRPRPLPPGLPDPS